MNLGLANLYLTEQGATLRKKGDRLVVEKDGQRMLDVPCAKIETVLIFGNVQFTTQALRELFEHEIELAVLTRDGELQGQVTPIKNKNILLRLNQFRLCENKAFATQVAASIVKAKLGNSIAVLNRFVHNHPQPDVKARIDEIKSLVASLNRETPVSSLLGIEGTAARMYYSAMKHMALGDMRFPGRVRRPPTDPANALLSFGYVIVGNELQSLLDAIGLDPYLGFLHAVEYGRPSLALDVLEEFRAPLVDRLMLHLVNRRILTSAHFEPRAQGGLRLTREAMKIFLGQYEKWVTGKSVRLARGGTKSFRELLRGQVEAMARCVRDGAPYTPFEFR